MPRSAHTGGRREELERLVRHHQNAYYNGEAEISDAEFDALWDELKSIAPDSPVLAAVGADAGDGFRKQRHILPMGSQEKAADPDEFLVWCAKVNHPEYLVELKMDGASLELQYELGELRYAVTRGDGAVGDDITRNARSMRGVPTALPFPFSGAVRGEVLMSKATLQARHPDKANCRNAANGIMKRKDGVGAADLDVVCYDAAPSGLYDGAQGSEAAHSAPPPFDDEIAKLAWLRSAGFTVVESELCATPYDVVEYRARVMAARDASPYDMDGLVVKGRRVDPDDMRRARPEKQIAFKFALEEAVSTLLGVEWSESGATFTPIALIEPVRLAGTTVKRANLANTNTIDGMGLRIGSRVVVVKRGEIIPKIEGVVDTPDGAEAVPVPTSCSCGASLVDEGTRLYCPNQACPKKLLHRVEKWLSVLDVRDFGGAITGKLVESGRVRSIADLYSIDAEELASYDRMGPTLAAKLVQNLRARGELGLAEFVAGFDIEGIGLTMAEKAVAAGYDSLEKLRAAAPGDFASIDGFGDITGAVFAAGLAALRADMDAVLATGLVAIRAGAAAGGVLSGLSFCFTGELATMKRSRAEALVKSLGGQVRSSVAKGLSYLVTNDAASGSAKAKSAQKLGIPILDEAAFVGLVGKENA